MSVPWVTRLPSIVWDYFVSQLHLGFNTVPNQATLLIDWLVLRGDHPRALFHPTLKGGWISPRRMSDQAVLDILRHRGEQAQVSAFSPHDFRRTFISNLLDTGADISTVQKLAGHASPVTTTRYDCLRRIKDHRREEAAKQKAAWLLHTPYYR
jgi:integrase